MHRARPQVIDCVVLARESLRGSRHSAHGQLMSAAGLPQFVVLLPCFFNLRLELAPQMLQRARDGARSQLRKVRIHSARNSGP